MTSPWRKPVGPRRGRRGNDKLILSLGSWLLPSGPPEGLAFSPSGTFLLRDALPVVPCWRRRVHYTPAACDPPLAGVRLPSPLVQGCVIGALSDSKRKGRKRGRRPIGSPSPFEGDHSTEENQRSRREATPGQLVPSCLPNRLPFLCRSQPIPVAFGMAVKFIPS